MKAGDTVHDSVTGDDLVLAWYDPQRDEACWLGWPEGLYTKASERLSLVAECSEEESLKLLRELVDGQASESGIRRMGARAELDRWAAAHPFESAEFYDCRESERLSHGSVEEALEEYFDVHVAAGPFAAAIANHGPVEVLAYKARDITQAALHSLAVSLREQAYDSLTEDYGDMEGDLPGLTAQVEAELEAGFNDVLTRVLAAHKVRAWQCEVVAKRMFEPAEIEELLRDHCPEWFEEEDKSA